VLELAADSWAAGLGHGESFKSTLGVRHEDTQEGGGSRSEERHGLAAAILRIDRRRENSVHGLSEKYSRTQHLLWFDDSIPMSDPPLP
jgi:hypothetical protein